MSPPQSITRYININNLINMVVMKTVYKYRAYPLKEQKEMFNRQMFIANELYNLLFEKSKVY